MSMRINLLKETEFRYSGAVSHRFIAQIVLIAGVAISLLIVALALFHVRSIRQDLVWHQDQWARLEPLYLKIDTMQLAAGANEKLIGELKGRSAWRMPWNELLPELQKVVPAYVQLSSMDVIAMVDRDEKDDDTPARRYDIRMNGKALGADADKVVFSFINSVESSEAFKDLLTSVKLQGMTRIDNGRQFGIEAKTITKKMAWTGKT